MHAHRDIPISVGSTAADEIADSDTLKLFCRGAVPDKPKEFYSHGSKRNRKRDLEFYYKLEKYDYKKCSNNLCLKIFSIDSRFFNSVH